jgi:AcrR family transcriptional regulator
MNNVDHEERKRLIAAKTLSLIAEEGIERATIRRIAEELGFSTRSITHYFADKGELIEWVADHMAETGFAIVAPLADDALELSECLVSMTAIDQRNRHLWKVYIALWDLSSRNAAMADWFQRWTRRINDLVAGTIARHHPGHEDCEGSARKLIALVKGISVQSLLDPDTWTEAEVRTAVTGHMRSVLGSASATEPRGDLCPS